MKYCIVCSDIWVEIKSYSTLEIAEIQMLEKSGMYRDGVSVSHSVIDWTFFKMTDNILFFLWLE